MPRMIRNSLALFVLCVITTPALSAQGRGGGGFGGGRSGRGGTGMSGRGRQGNIPRSLTYDPKLRLTSIENAIAAIDSALAKQPPGDLTKAQHTEWDGETKWLTTTRKQLADCDKKLSAAVFVADSTVASRDTTMSSTSRPPSFSQADIQKLAQLNTQFIALQKKIIDAADKRYQKLSDLSKPRDDMAVKAIKAMK